MIAWFFSDSTALGVGVPSFLPILADKGLVSSLTERGSSGVGGNRDKIQLAQPGKLNIEEKSFLRGKGGEDSGFVSEAALLKELTQSKDNSLVPLISGSEYFSPSAFVNLDIRGGGRFYFWWGKSI